MITEVKINWFKWLKEATYQLGQDTIITWSNWQGKSRIIEAIIYCLTWEVNWYKKKLKDCSVTISWPRISVSRVNWKLVWTNESKSVKAFLSGIIPWYINSLTIKDKIKVLTWVSEEWSLPFNSPFNNYIDYKESVKDLKKFTKLLDVYSEEIINNMEKIRDIWNIELDNLIDLKKRYDILVRYKEDIAENSSIQLRIDEWEKHIKELEEQLVWYDTNVDLHFIKEQLVKKINDYNQMKLDLMTAESNLETLEFWKCFTCNQEVSDQILITKAKDKVSTLKQQIKSTKILQLKKELKELDLKITKQEWLAKLNRELAWISLPSLIPIASNINYTTEEFEDLEIKLSNFQELFSKTEQKKLLIERNKELSNKIKWIDILILTNSVNEFENNEKKYFLSQEKLFKDFNFNIKLYKENQSTDWGQLVYEIEKDWVDYFWLSSWQQLLIDTVISLHISSQNNIMSDYVLIDNWERLSNDNFKKVLQLLWDRQIIITKVSQSKLALEID